LQRGTPGAFDPLGHGVFTEGVGKHWHPIPQELLFKLEDDRHGIIIGSPVRDQLSACSAFGDALEFPRNSAASLWQPVNEQRGSGGQ
jgi:hypothetical protein